MRRRHAPTWDRFAAITEVLETSRPVLAIPCDDPARYLLTEAYARLVAKGRTNAAEIIARSLGDPTRFLEAEERARVLATMKKHGVRMPRTRALLSIGDVDAAFAEFSTPLVIKRDRTWGGEGVEVCATVEQARRAFVRMNDEKPWRRALAKMFWERDLVALPQALAQRPTAIVAQEYIEGEPANCVAACWNGEVVAELSVQAEEMNPRPIGPSTVVRIIDNAEMRQTAVAVAREFGLSGICGFDFMIQAKTGNAYFLELNARATPTSHIGRGPSADLGRALARRCGLPFDEDDAPARDLTMSIPLFPSEWVRDPTSRHLASIAPPWDDPALMAGFAIDFALRASRNKSRLVSLLDRLAMRHLQRRLLALAHDDECAARQRKR